MYDDSTNNQNSPTSPLLGGDQPAPTIGLGTNPSSAGYPSQTVQPTEVHPDPTLTPMPGTPSYAQPVNVNTTPSVAPATASTPSPSSASSLPPPVISATVTQPNDNLTVIKNKALTELSPLVSKLDQSPEERYKTLMMMIQASDDQSLIQEAYQAAQNIADEKARAEALLNIVNEINYFTQKSA
jgi:hypothetical protein